MGYTVLLPKPVQKQLDALPDSIRQNLIQRILSLREMPRPVGCVKLKGFDHEYRLRVGDYRIRYLIEDGEKRVVILHCLHRKDIYRK